MGDVVTRPAGLPDLLREPVFSQPVEIAVRQYLDYAAHGNLGRFGVPVLSEELRKRAKNYVALADERGGPATWDAIRKWLLIVTSGVNNPPVGQDFGTRVSAIEMACHDLPAWGFNEETARAALVKFKWLPSAAETRELILEATAPRLAKIRALRALAAAQAPPDDAGATPMAPEQRNAVACGLRALVEEQQAKARLSDPGPMARREVRPHHLRPDMAAAVRDANPIVQAARAAKAGT